MRYEVCSLTSYFVVVLIQPFIKLLFVSFFPTFLDVSTHLHMRPGSHIHLGAHKQARIHPHFGFSNKLRLTPILGLTNNLGLPPKARLPQSRGSLQVQGLPSNFGISSSLGSSQVRTSFMIFGSGSHGAHTWLTQS